MTTNHSQLENMAHNFLCTRFCQCMWQAARSSALAVGDSCDRERHTGAKSPLRAVRAQLKDSFCKWSRSFGWSAVRGPFMRRRSPGKPRRAQGSRLSERASRRSRPAGSLRAAMRTGGSSVTGHSMIGRHPMVHSAVVHVHRVARPHVTPVIVARRRWRRRLRLTRCATRRGHRARRRG